MPIVDGWTPITVEDLNVYGATLRRISEILGAGPNGPTSGSTVFGPKGSNADVADRLNEFLEKDGRLVDIAFVTGTAQLGDFSELRNGIRIGFGKTLSRAGEGSDSYAILFDAMIPDIVSGSWNVLVPCQWWTSLRLKDSVEIIARDMNGNTIAIADSTAVKYSLLVIGEKALSTWS